MNNNCSVEIWTTKKIYLALKNKKSSNGEKISVPVFQRGLCWKTIDEEKLIDSIYNKYPIGSLLFYKKSGENEYVLIDGLQRANTIRKFFDNKEDYFSMSFLSEQTNKTILNIKEKFNLDDHFDLMISELIKTFVKENINDSSKFSNKLFEKMDTDYSVYSDLNELSSNIFSDLEKFIYIQDYHVPVIIFESDKNESISEIFKRINTEGKKLSIFDIFAASWNKDKVHTNDQNIINYVINRYNIYLKNGLAIDNYNLDNIKKDGQVTAFEYVFGLGKLLEEKFKDLFITDTDNSPDSISHIGFDLLNLCYHHSNKEMENLDKVIITNKDFIDNIKDNLIDSCTIISNLVKPVVLFKGNSQKSAVKILHSYWQILSMIAHVFLKKYDIKSNKLINHFDKKVRDNLKKYYIFDILVQNWREGNIGFAYRCISSNRFDDELTKNEFISALDSYFEMQLNYKEVKTVNGPMIGDYVILNTIYKRIFTAEDQLDDEYAYDIEHICPKKQMLNKIRISLDTNNPEPIYGLPISSIANLCYLPRKINRSKKDKTIYQDETINKDDLYLLEKNYTFTTKNDLMWIEKSYKNDFNNFKTNYIKFLRGRYNVIKEKFLETLGYKFVENDDIKEDFNIMPKFENLKVGELANEIFRSLFNNNLIDDDEMNNLLNEEYCKENFKLTNYAVLSESKVFKSNKIRSYSKPISYKNKEYFLISEWYDTSRDCLINYYFSFNNK